MDIYRTLLPIAFTTASLFGCSPRDSLTANEGVGVSDALPTSLLGEPPEYFPTARGSHWTYDIAVASFEANPPLVHFFTDWPLDGGRTATYETRGRLVPPRNRTPDGRCQLVLSVAGTVGKEGPFEYSEGYELQIERDDLHIFADSGQEGRSDNKLFWAISRAAGYRANLIVLHNPDSPDSPVAGSWGHYGQLPGFSLRVAFFGEKPMTSVSLHGQNDELLFVGPETHGNREALHFRRIVAGGEASENAGNILSKGFIEDMWFAKREGLIELVQVVDGNVTMRWLLTDSRYRRPALVRSDPQQLDPLCIMPLMIAIPNASQSIRTN